MVDQKLAPKKTHPQTVCGNYVVVLSQLQIVMNKILRARVLSKLYLSILIHTKTIYYLQCIYACHLINSTDSSKILVKP